MISINFNPITEESNIALGNSMFQYVVCRTIAEKNGYNFYIPNGQYLLKVFPKINLGLKDGEVKYEYVETHNQKYNPELLNIPDFTNIIGHFNTDKYIIGNEDKVKNWFSFDVDDETKTILEKYPSDKYCYIHLRGGDFKTAGGILLPKNYFLDAINFINQRYNLSFVIITNDLDLSRSYFPEIDSIYNDVVTDFKVLNLCKYAIISNSGFSWWARWMSDGVTVAPKNWLNYNRPFFGCHPIDVQTEKFTFV